MFRGFTVASARRLLQRPQQGFVAHLSRSTATRHEDSNSSPSPQPEEGSLGLSIPSMPDLPEEKPSSKAALPFFVRRSKTGNLPVYTDFKHGRKTVLTQIKKIDGNIMAMEKMLREELREPLLHTRVDEITQSITIHGNYRSKVAQWLEGFGF